MEFVYVRPKLCAKQTAAFFDPRDCDGNLARYSWIEGSTKSGKTVSCMAWIFEKALFVATGRSGRQVEAIDIVA